MPRTAVVSPVSDSKPTRRIATAPITVRKRPIRPATIWEGLQVLRSTTVRASA